MLDGKLQDDATYRQCRVIPELAASLAQRDPGLAGRYAP